jgi:hypothetical protein
MKLGQFPNNGAMGGIPEGELLGTTHRADAQEPLFTRSRNASSFFVGAGRQDLRKSLGAISTCQAQEMQKAMHGRSPEKCLQIGLRSMLSAVAVWFGWSSKVLPGSNATFW